MINPESQERFIVQAVKPRRRTFYIGVPETDPGMRVKGVRMVGRRLGFWPRAVLSRGIVYRDVAESDQAAIEKERIRLVTG